MVVNTPEKWRDDEYKAHHINILPDYLFTGFFCFTASAKVRNYLSWFAE